MPAVEVATRLASPAERFSIVHVLLFFPTILTPVHVPPAIVSFAEQNSDCPSRSDFSVDAIACPLSMCPYELLAAPTANPVVFLDR